MMTETADTTAQETATATAPKLAKTAAITLTGPNGTLQIVAERRAHDARTFVFSTDTAKKTSRGMTTVYPTWEAAVAAIAGMAKSAEKLGWTRRAARKGFTARADAFVTLPASAAPKAAKK